MHIFIYLIYDIIFNVRLGNFYMSFDGIVTSAIVAELKSNILGGKIEKIYQPEREQLFFFIHAKGKKHMLFISSRSNHSA